VRLLGGTDLGAIGDALGRRIGAAGARLPDHWLLLLGAAVVGGVIGIVAGFPAATVVFSSFLSLAIAAFVALVIEDRYAGHGAAEVDRASDGGQTDRWRAVLDAVPDPVLVLDSAGTIIHVNPAAREFRDTVRIGGQPALLSRDPEFLQAVDEVLENAHHRTIEVQERVPIDRRVRITLTAVLETQGEHGPRVIIDLRDLTEQDRLGRMRADFVANASHELRTPLASLVGFIETLQGRASEDPAARQRFLGIMSQQAARMARLVDDLLSLSRVEMREHVPPRTAIDLNEVISTAVQALEPVALSSGGKLSLSLCDGPAVVLGDTDEIVQIVQNLVQNGLKYGGAGGTVSISVRRVRQGPTMRIAVAVRDEGAGIAPEHLPRLTERFYRVSAKSSREKGGTGLGLAIVKHIVNRHRGELRIESELGKGSTFTFLIDEQARRLGLVR
jgi:two-component system phosphate regulon sensor histidine kinase PhoR